MKTSRFVFLSVVVLVSLLSAEHRIKLFARGGGIGAADYLSPVVGDFNNDDTVEIAYQGKLRYPTHGFQVWKFIPPNRFELARMDTWPAYPVPGVTPAMFNPQVLADVNDDGRQELVGWGLYRTPDSVLRSCIEVVGCRSGSRYPDTVLWWRNYHWTPEQTATAVADLDGDSIKEIIYNSCFGNKIVEHRGFNRFDSVASFTGGTGHAGFPAGDFDQDGRQEFVTSSGSPIRVFKCIREDSFCMVDQQSLWPGNNHIDLFLGRNVDGTNVPKYFTAPNAYGGPGGWTFYLYMGAWVVDRYVYTLLDTVQAAGDWGRWSRCGDIDGDSLEEIVWSVGTKVLILKWNGGGFDRVWTWSRSDGSCSLIEIYDLNRDGYNDFLVSGVDSTYYFEMEGVRLHSPNGREEYLPGDSVNITWETFTPPRCDSLSLFYSTDSGRSYPLIAHGLPPGETSYSWVAPDVRSTVCLVKVVAYGPGTLYDESDSCFSILSTTVGAGPVRNGYRTQLLGVQPNPVRDRASIRFGLRDAERVRLRLSDATGRTVLTLLDETRQPGHHALDWPRTALPRGIYFLGFAAGAVLRTEKVVVE